MSVLSDELRKNLPFDPHIVRVVHQEDASIKLIIPAHEKRNLFTELSEGFEALEKAKEEQTK